ncbi:hypothetical protein BSZ21_05340 [Bradyrhizobium canariense]|uniref:hypothetical protein n=1 Tax=Bradyrhizobium canariense TaxID=255045 RepID=UPI000A19B3E9|nr:hypothetical protein [Bradyrhizobium canariense]OSI74981.1 hypothetical protein BSZ21_05340 [Bradyrhizobium canariense]
MEQAERPQLLSAQECAIVLLRLIELRNEDAASTTRVRISELTLRRLWGRHRLDRDLLDEVQEWLFRGGWTLFFAGTTYAAIKTSAVLNWSRLSSNRLLDDLGSDDLRIIQNGGFDFAMHARLLAASTDTYDND